MLIGVFIVRKQRELCSLLNNLRAENPLAASETAIFKHGITLANRTVVKKTITYREITVAIGILVAMVIAFTLWIHDPQDTITGFESGSNFDLPAAAKTFLKATSAIFTELR